MNKIFAIVALSACISSLYAVKPFSSQEIQKLKDALQANFVTAVQTAADESKLHLPSDKSYGPYLAKAKEYINQGATINAPSGAKNETLLHRAITSPVVVKFLVENGANINAQDAQGNTPFMSLLNLIITQPTLVFATKYPHASENLLNIFKALQSPVVNLSENPINRKTENTNYTYLSLVPRDLRKSLVQNFNLKMDTSLKNNDGKTVLDLANEALNKGTPASQNLTTIIEILNNNEK